MRSRSVWLIIFSTMMLLLGRGESSRAQGVRGGPNAAQMYSPGVMLNPYSNPYTNPYINQGFNANPMMYGGNSMMMGYGPWGYPGMFPGGGRAGFIGSMATAQAAQGGIGSGMMSGTRSMPNVNGGQADSSSPGGGSSSRGTQRTSSSQRQVGRTKPARSVYSYYYGRAARFYPAKR